MVNTVISKPDDVVKTVNRCSVMCQSEKSEKLWTEHIALEDYTGDM